MSLILFGDWVDVGIKNYSISLQGPFAICSQTRVYAVGDTQVKLCNSKILIEMCTRKMSPIVPQVELSDGNKIPILGFGSYSLGEKTKDAVKYAIQIGYRHFDCAHLYGNEKEIGEAIREMIASGIVRREDLFITTKCWNTYHEKERVLECCQKSLSDLGLDYVDLYLIHWPMGFKPDGDNMFPTGKDSFANVDYVETWKGMEECKARGWVRSIGLSNFNSEQINRVLNAAKVKPVVNQVECHPYLSQQKLLDFCKARKIVLTAYCPLGTPNTAAERLPNAPLVFNDPKIKEIANKYGKSVAQILLRYQVQRGVVVIPKSANEQRIKENFNIFDFELSENDMEVINSCNQDIRLVHLSAVKDHPFYPFHLPY